MFDGRVVLLGTRVCSIASRVDAGRRVVSWHRRGATAQNCCHGAFMSLGLGEVCIFFLGTALTLWISGLRLHTRAQGVAS